MTPGAEVNAKLDVVVKPNFAAAQNMVESDRDARIWQGFVEPALAAGQFRYKPDAEVVENGLDSVQKAVNLLAQGVSARKLVVAL